MSELKKKVVQGVFWTGLERASMQGLQLVLGIILARLLSPEEFGIVGMVTVFITLLDMFVRSGFPGALIQRKTTTRLEESSVFYFNIFISIVGALLLYLCAPLIVKFYEMEALLGITRALSAILVISAFKMIHTTLLTKAINFKIQFWIEISCRLISGTTAIILAYRGFGVWSLVYQQLIQAVLQTMGYWIICKWRPLFAFSFKALKGFWEFGSKLLAGNVIRVFSNNIYTLLIGKLFSAESLGLYSRGRSFARMPQTMISSTIGRLTFPLFSSLQNDEKRFVSAVSRSFQVMMFFSIPLFLVLFSIAKPLIRLVLTDKWLLCVPYFQLFCFISILYPWQQIIGESLLAKGRSDITLRINILTNALRLISIIVTYRWGVLAIVWGELLLTIIVLLFSTSYTYKVYSFGLLNQLSEIGLFFVFGGVSFLVLQVALRTMDIEHLLLQCIVGITIILFVYGLACFIFKRDVLKIIFSLIRR